MPAYVFDKIINPLPKYRAESKSENKDISTEIKLFE